MQTRNYAQTNLQLYAELKELGYSAEQFEEVDRAYQLAILLFTGRYRSNGKVFLAHLVGTASILARHGAAPAVVLAGLLHAAYLQGEFGDGRFGVNYFRRRKVRKYVSQEVETLLQAYFRLPWNYQTLLNIKENFDNLSPLKRKVILVRIANDMEDHLDLGMQYSRKKDLDFHQVKEKKDVLIQIAGQLGADDLAAELAALYALEDSAEVPEALLGKRNSSFTVGPASHRYRLELRVLKYMLVPYRYFTS